MTFYGALEQRKAKAGSGARLVTYGEANHTAAAGLTVGLGHTLNLILLLDGIAAGHTTSKCLAHMAFFVHFKLQ